MFLKASKINSIYEPNIIIQNITIPFQNFTLFNCTNNTVATYSSVENCSNINITINANDFFSLNNVSLTNPAPANCITKNVQQFRVVSPPIITEVIFYYYTH